MWQLRIKKMLIAICILCGMSIFLPERAEADEYTDAYEFYQKHGSEMVFVPNLGTPDGTIYYGTIAKQASGSRILYRTLGWKVTVRNHAGVVLDQLYYRIGGSYMKQVDERIVNGYEYDIYSLSLLDIRNHLKPQAQQALKTANCSVTFDACTTVVINGVLQGNMTDEGVLSGEVYTTYAGISNAQNWSANSKETLKSYYNKGVPDLFCTVSLSCGNGISSVSGSGKYLYGTEVTIDAVTERGYEFKYWYGTKNSPLKKTTFTVDRNIYMTAEGKVLEMSVYFYRNLTPEDAVKEYSRYLYTDAAFPMKTVDWKKKGYHQLGWNTERTATKELFGRTEDLPLAWLESIAPSTNLYAIWEPNRYTIVFNGQGAEGSVAPITVTYADTVTLPVGSFIKEGESQTGWCLSPTDNTADYEVGETVNVAELVDRANLADVNHAIITLYVVWDAAPEIIGDDIYVTLRQIGEGIVSEEWLARYMKAADAEDGTIDYGRNVQNAFYVVDYSMDDFYSFTKSGYLTQTFYAVDSSGNETYKTIKVHIVDDAVSGTKQLPSVRFISAKYYKNEQGEWIDEQAGGLLANSIWRLEETYRNILDELFLEA